MATNIDDRLQTLVEAVSDPHSQLHFDLLLDSITSIIYEANAGSSGTPKKWARILNRLVPVVKKIEASRPNISDFTVIKLLGKGAYGEVSLVRHTLTKQVFAMKKQIKYNTAQRGEAACILEEREVLLSFDSEWLVKMYYSFQDTLYLYMIMEFMQGGDMVGLMQEYEPNEYHTKFYFCELALALNTMHEMGFLHRDVKPDNMLLDSKGHLKLCDFGTATRVNKDGKVITNVSVGTPDYLAPEIVKKIGDTVCYGKEVDWWAAGVWLYEMLFETGPFYSETVNQTYDLIRGYETLLKYPTDHEYSNDAVNFIKCFLTSPEKRLGANSFDEIKNHPWCHDPTFTWDNIRSCPAPVEPEFSDPEDTANFDVYSDKDAPVIASELGGPPFSGNHIPFIGFTYSGKYSFGADKTKLSSSPDNSALVESYRETIGKLEESISVLQKRYTLANQSLQELMLDKQKLSNDSSELKANFAEKIAENKSLKIQVLEITSQLQLVQKELQQNKNITLEQKFRLDELEEMAKSYTTEMENYNQLKEDNSKLQTRFRTLESEISEYMKNEAKSEEIINSLRKVEKELRCNYKQVVEEHEKMEESYNQIKIGKATLETDFKNISIQLSETLDSLNKLSSEHSLLMNESKLIRDELDQIQKMFDCTSIYQLKDKLELTRSEGHTLQNKLRQYEIEIASYEQKLSESSRLQDPSDVTLKSRFNIMVTERDSLQAELEESNKRQEALSAKYDKVVQELIDVNNEQYAFTAKIQELNQKLIAAATTEEKMIKEKEQFLLLRQTLEDKVNEITQECEEKEKIVVDLREQIISQENFISMYKTKIEDLQGDIKDKQLNTTHLEKSVATLKDINRELTTNIGIKESFIRKLQASNEELQEELSKTKLAIVTLENETRASANLGKEILLKEEKICKMELHSASLISEISEKENEIVTLRSTITNLENEISANSSRLLAVEDAAKKSILQEKMLKDEAIKKLREVLGVDRLGGGGSNARGVRRAPDHRSSKDKKYEQLYRQTQVQLREEQVKSEKALREHEKKVAELNTNIADLNSLVTSLHKELASLNDAYENKYYTGNSGDKTPSTPSHSSEFTNTRLLRMLDSESEQTIKECYLYTLHKPKRSSRKTLFHRVSVKLTNKALSIYKDDESRFESIPQLTIYLSKIFLVRQVSQNDIFRASPNEVAKTFQIIYSDENEDQLEPAEKDEKLHEKYIVHANHYFLATQYHMPCTCDACGKGLWGLFKSSQAYECKNCHFRCHKEHVNDSSVTPCKFFTDSKIAKEIMLMAETVNEQTRWIELLSYLSQPHFTPNKNKARSSIYRRSEYSTQSDFNGEGGNRPRGSSVLPDATGK